MIKCALLLLSCLTIFAQRTPLSVNGTVVNNPNFTNTASVTWSVTGPNIRGTASAGSDSFWTNSSVAAGSIQPVGGSNVYMPGTLAVVGQLTNDALQASQLVYSGPDKVLSSISPGNSGDVLTSSGAGIAPSFLPVSGGDTIWTNDNGTISATSEAAAGVEAFKMDTSIAHTSGNLFEINNNGVDVLYVSWDGSVSTAGSLAGFYADDGTGYITVDAYGQFGIEVAPDYTAKLSLYPTDPDGGVPYEFNTTLTHTGGNLVTFENNDVEVFSIDYTGKTTAVAGFSSTATDAAVTIASTGWTNTFGKNAVVYMDGVGLTYTVYDNALTPVYTNSVTVVNATVILQPSGKVIITDGTLGVGRATPF